MLAFLKRSKPDYQTQLEWGPTKQILLAWDIKLIAHDWKPLGFPIIVLMILATITIISSSFIKMNIAFPTLSGSVLFMGTFILLQVRVKNQFVYRLTLEGIEYQHWRVYPEFLFSGAKGMLVAIGVIVLIAGIFSQHGFLILDRKSVV